MKRAHVVEEKHCPAHHFGESRSFQTTTHRSARKRTEAYRCAQHLALEMNGLSRNIEYSTEDWIFTSLCSVFNIPPSVTFLAGFLVLSQLDSPRIHCIDFVQFLQLLWQYQIQYHADRCCRRKPGLHDQHNGIEKALECAIVTRV